MVKGDSYNVGAPPDFPIQSFCRIVRLHLKALKEVIDANPSPEIKRELAERFGLILSAIRCIDSECVRPVSVIVLQARARLFQNVAKKFLDIGAGSKPCPFRNKYIASVTFSVR